MGIVPVFFPRPKRLHGKRNAIVASEPPSNALTVSAVTNVVFEGPSGSLVVVFDIPAGQGLNNPEGADPAKWTAVVNTTTYVGSEFLFDGGTQMTVLFSDLGGGADENTLSYAADPSDISDSLGRFPRSV